MFNGGFNGRISRLQVAYTQIEPTRNIDFGSGSGEIEPETFGIDLELASVVRWFGGSISGGLKKNEPPEISVRCSSHNLARLTLFMGKSY